ncbi:hypothetical protein B0H13DRAFT_1889355 [Mycena leptocephala]|nr:hypothetical protein B0H13DRAFT_1889355 [Mycena leptocephala]
MAPVQAPTEAQDAEETSKLPDPYRVSFGDLPDEPIPKELCRLLMTAKLKNTPSKAVQTALKTITEEVVGFRIDKDLAQSDWSAIQLTKEQIESPLRLYHVLKVTLEKNGRKSVARFQRDSRHLTVDSETRHARGWQQMAAR